MRQLAVHNMLYLKMTTQVIFKYNMFWQEWEIIGPVRNWHYIVNLTEPFMVVDLDQLYSWEWRHTTANDHYGSCNSRPWFLTSSSKSSIMFFLFPMKRQSVKILNSNSLVRLILWLINKTQLTLDSLWPILDNYIVKGAALRERLTAILLSQRSVWCFIRSSPSALFTIETQIAHCR